MKTSFLTLAAAALLLAGCSKEELTENVSEGTSSVATRTNARFGNPGGMPEVWFNQNNGRMLLRVPPRWTHVALTASAKNYSLNGNEDPNDGTFVDEDGDGVFEYQEWSAELGRVGNSRIYRSGKDQFVFGQTAYFSLVDVTLTSSHFVDDWQGETAYLQLFVYPSGRTVEQDPKIYFRRGHIQETISGEWDEAIAELTIVIADDPAQQVEKVKFVPDPIYPYADDPTYAVYPEPSYLEKTHENTNLGLSRWIGPGRGGVGSSGSFGGTIYMIAADGQTLDTNFALLLN